MKKSTIKRSKNVNSKKKDMPIGVKIISILNYCIAVIMLLAAIALLFIGSTVLTVLSLEESLGIEGTVGFSILVILSLFFLFFAVIGFFIGRGLWKGQNWARIVVITFSILGVISGIISLIAGEFDSILGLGVDLVVGGYLLFNSKVKSAFS